MNKEFTRMQELAGISLNEATQIEADVEKWLEGYLKGTVLTSNDDIEKYGSLDDPKKVKYVVDGGFKTGMLDVKYSYNKEYMHIPLKDIQDLAKKIGVEDSDSYKVEDAVQNALKKKGLKQKLETSFDRSGLKVGEMMSQFFRDPNQKQPLDENFVGMGMVGNIFDREKEKYEDAFEHFLSERYEEKVEESNTTNLDKNIQSDPEFLKKLTAATKKAENGDSTELATLMVNNLEEKLTSQQLDLSTLKSILLRASKVGGKFNLGGQDFENKEKLKQYLSGLVDDLFNKEK